METGVPNSGNFLGGAHWPPNNFSKTVANTNFNFCSTRGFWGGGGRGDLIFNTPDLNFDSELKQQKMLSLYGKCVG